ncbi:response regulator transcription factor [Flavobacterium sp.]|uniref:response regulator transcription factor n=1 Tax=Flavobacterium sp. TaxID=239 RepID=UPI0028BD8D2A|nr:response regulator transcription factor [Flavobacterium sp.]
MPLNVLFVDDHPSQIMGYKTILSFNDQGIEIAATECHNCKEAYQLITEYAEPSFFDLVFLDRSMPAYEEKGIHSGEDLGVLIKHAYPNTKIIILTSHVESFIIYDIVKKVNPEGLLIKSDFDGEELLKAFEVVMEGGTYFSKTVDESVKQLLTRQDYLDNINRQIITLLSKGFKTKSIASEVNLTESAVEKRKSKIRDIFCINKGNDEDIIREARNQGLI